MTAAPASPKRALLWVAFGALLISFSPALVKRIVPETMGPTAVGFYRTLFGGLALIVVARLRGDALRMRPALFGLAAFAGFMFSMDLGSWHRAIPLIGSGLATLLANTQVVWVALAGTFVFKEGGGWKLAASVVLSICGVALVAGVLTPQGMPQADTWGVVLGLSTGVYYAAFLLTLRRGQARPDAPSVFVFMAWTALCTAAFLAVGTVVHAESFVIPDLTSWLCVLGLALVVQAGAWTILTNFMPHIPAALGALLLLLQPTFATLWGALFFGEALTAYEAVGGVLILIAIYLGSSMARRRATRASGRPRLPEDAERFS